MTGLTFGNYLAALAILINLIGGAVLTGKVLGKLEAISERVSRIEGFIDRFTRFTQK